MKKEYFMFSVKDLTEGGIMVALAMVLNFVKIPIGATGGSINLQMLPLMVYSLRKGVFKGFIISGIVYGGVSCLVDSSGSLINFPFDYLLGFGSCALFGLFSHEIFDFEKKYLAILFLAISAILVMVGRVMSSTLSSMVFYGYNFVAALIYNLLYIVPSTLASFVLILILFGHLKKIHKNNR